MLTVSAMPKGHMKIQTSMKHCQYSSPENGEWNSNICFYDYPESLTQLIQSKDEIKN